MVDYLVNREDEFEAEAELGVGLQVEGLAPGLLAAEPEPGAVVALEVVDQELLLACLVVIVVGELDVLLGEQLVAPCVVRMKSYSDFSRMESLSLASLPTLYFSPSFRLMIFSTSLCSLSYCTTHTPTVRSSCTSSTLNANWFPK